jgi:prepilin-type N-terminal cleavage/methylation domain-containing protein
MKINNPSNLQKGFTLIELLLVIAVIGMMSSVGIVTFINYSKSQALQQAVLDFASTLNTAKSKSYAQAKPASCNGSLNGYNVVTTATSYSLNVVCSGGTVNVATTTLSGIAIAPAKTIFFQVTTGGVIGSGVGAAGISFTQGSSIKKVIISPAGVISIQ